VSGGKIPRIVLKPQLLLSGSLALAYWLGGAGARVRRNGSARVLMLHGVPRRDAGLFERVVRYVRRHFDVVPLQAIAAAAQSDDAAGLRGRLAITFDDGLRNNVEVAYPILKSHGVPATFFVCPELAERGEWLWNHEARQRLLRLAPPALRELASELACGAEVESIVQRMKRLPLRERRRAEARVREATPGFAPSAAERHDFDLASWSELRALDPRLVAIGSHTLTHPILPMLAADELEHEVVGSRRMLEARLDRSVELFAYPNGDADEATLACVRRTYAAAVTVQSGWVAPGCEPHSLPRVNVPRSMLRLALALHRAPRGDYFFVTPTSASGSQVASSGNTVISPMHSTIMKKKGSEASAT
jgi:peptidoglycan/xylan/chitin deacetylase (PgdA/CDA1 family)